MDIHPIWYLCLTIRTLLATGISILPPSEKKLLTNLASLLLLLIGLGFIRASIFGSNDETQVAKVFWHKTRVYHGLLYLTAASLLFSGYPKQAGLFIIIDILFSVIYRLVTNQ